MRSTLSFVLGFGLLLAVPAWGDEVVLTNGSVFRGVVREQGDKVQVEVDFGTMTFRRAQVRSIIRSDSPIREFDAKIAGTADAQACYELGLWAREKGLKTRSREMFRKAIGLNPDHEKARTALGYLRFDGRWMTEDEFMVARGFVKQRGEWLKRETVERREDNAVRERIEYSRQQTARDLARIQADLEQERLDLERERLECERRRRRFPYRSGFPVVGSALLPVIPAPPSTSALPPATAWPSPITPMNLTRTSPVQTRPVPAARPPKRLPPAPPWPSPVSGRRP